MSTVTTELPPASTYSDSNGFLAFWKHLDKLEPLPEYLEEKAAMRQSVIALFTPLNLALFVVFVTVLWYSTRGPPEVRLPNGQKPIVFRSFTPRILLKYNGEKNNMNPDAKVYIAVKGKVHDVTSGRNFYGPGGPYENFAGRDATRGLACQSFDDDMLTKDLDGPLDDCSDLTPDQLENLQGWAEKFDEKYLVVGKLTSFSKSKNEFAQ